MRKEERRKDKGKDVSYLLCCLFVVPSALNLRPVPYSAMAPLRIMLCWAFTVVGDQMGFADAHLMNNQLSGFVPPRHQAIKRSSGDAAFQRRYDLYARPKRTMNDLLFDVQQNDQESIAIAEAICDENDATSRSSLQRRQFLLMSALLATQLPLPSNAESNTEQQELLTTSTNYQKSPINKRSGITLSEPERIYPLNFITYLSRFLLVFDPECQAWWYTQATAIPTKSSKEDVDRMRLDQFGQFAASVEVGLVDFEGDGGPGVLLESLVKRYADISLEDTPSIDKKDPFSTLVISNTTQSSQQQQQKVRRKKEALRQIALMFSLLKDYQPVDLITQLLAADDDAKIDKVVVTDGGAGYLPPEYGIPQVSFPNPPTLGTVFGGSVAQGSAILEGTGSVLKVVVIGGGSGYAKAPVVTISDPTSKDSETASARAIMGKGKAKSSIERIDIVNAGTGYSSMRDITVKISPPDNPEGTPAIAKAILEYRVASVEVSHVGKGYAAERPVRINIDPPSSGGTAATAMSYPRGKSTSFKSFWAMGESEVNNAQVPDSSSNWVIGPTSSQILTLLPSGVGLEFDTSLKRYILATAQASDFDDSLFGTLEGMNFKPLNPIFGVRGRSPIEREKSLDPSTVLRFIASGAVCSSVAHLALTPIDVVKTKVQTKPDVYSDGIVDTFQKVLNEEGAKTFFDGWQPTFVGFFFTGGISFFFTEYFRRLFTSLLESNMMVQSSMSEVAAQAATASFEIPIVAASAACSGFLCCFVLSPFDAVRIRTVTQPDFADNIVGVVSRIIKEEGFFSLFSALNVWILKEVPYNVVKFLVFDGFTAWAYATYPAAQEDIRLSLAISLVGGTCGGIAASIVSNPADVIVTEMKKSKSDLSPLQAADALRQRAGLKAFAYGLQLRMIFYSLLVSLQFLLYDTVRIALGVGSDDMKLFLNVLGAALKEVNSA